MQQQFEFLLKEKIGLVPTSWNFLKLIPSVNYYFSPRKIVDALNEMLCSLKSIILLIVTLLTHVRLVFWLDRSVNWFILQINLMLSKWLE